MPETAAILQRYDNIFKNADLTVQVGTPPTEDDYQPASLVDDNPARVAKINSSTGFWLAEFPSAQRIDIIALIHHTFDPGATDVVVQANATDSWGSPSFDAHFEIPAWDGGLGVGARRWPVNPWLDLTEQTGYSATGWKFWRVGVTGNSQNLQLGQLVGHEEIARLDPDLQWAFQRSITKRQISNQTSFGVKTIYLRGTTEWRLEGDHIFDATLRAYLQDHFNDVGAAYPWLFVPEGLENRCYFVRWAGTDRVETQIMDLRVGGGEVHTNRFTIEEVSRGLRPGI